MAEESEDLAVYFRGERLYGDDFGSAEIQEWVADERNGYAKLVATERAPYAYHDHAINKRYGFSVLPRRKFLHVLGLGSAYGQEFRPILSELGEITIVEPSRALWSSSIEGHSVNYVEAAADGTLPFPDSSFDLITCFGVLHHIPNVSCVMRELFRCLGQDGYLLIREPTISFGDWSKPREGLTKRERGIPLDILRRMIISTGFELIREKRCMFSGGVKLSALMRAELYNSPTFVRIDRAFCILFAWNTTYHPKGLGQKLGPVSVFFVLRKP